MVKTAVQVTGYDYANSQHPTIVQSTGYMFEIASHNIYFDYATSLLDSKYSVDVYLSDMRPDSPNTLVSSQALDLDSLACQFLDRCSHDMLTFVW
jgi:hypothetical protein